MNPPACVGLCGCAMLRAGGQIMGEGKESLAVKCCRCGRLLGVMEGGEFVNKHGKQIIRAERADISCPRCGAVTHAGGAEERKENRAKRANLSRTFSSREGEGLGVRVDGGCPGVKGVRGRPSEGKR